MSGSESLLSREDGIPTGSSVQCSRSTLDNESGVSDVSKVGSCKDFCSILRCIGVGERYVHTRYTRS